MSEGITVELSELIQLKRYAQQAWYQPEGRAVRAGSHVSKLRGRGMDFAEVRNYQAGDEIRHMEWRVTARTGRPHVKIYQEERERPVVLVVDFNPSMRFGTRIAFKSVIAAKLATILAWTAVKQGDRVGGFVYSALNHQEFMPRSREASVLPMLSALAHYSQEKQQPTDCSQRDLAEVLLRLRRVTRPGSILVLISDFYAMNGDCQKHLNRLRAHNDILAYHICDPIELSPPQPQQYAMTDGQSELVLDTRMDEIYVDYQAYCDQRIAAIQAQCRQAQIQYNQVTAAMDLSQLVRQTFPRRKNGKG